MGPGVYFALCFLSCLAFSFSQEGARDRSLLRPRSPCPAGTLYSRNVCYEYLEEEVTWQEAEDYCQFWRAGHLASIQSDKEENIISKYIKQTNSPSRVWIGFHATPVSSKLKWGWADGFAYPPGSALWDNRKPSTTLSSSRCAALCNVQHPTASARWTQVDCSRTYSFLCKYPAAY